MAPPPVVHPPLDLLIVSTWFPSLDDPIAGRFVADQAEALLATGRVAPAVVSFELAGLIGAGGLRSRLARTVRDQASAAIATHPGVFSPRGHHLAPGIPVARLTVPGGRDSAAGALHGALARDGALGPLAERWRAGGSGRAGVVPLAVPPPALVHAHTVYPDGAGAATLARRLGCPLVITEHASFVARLVAEPLIRSRYLDTVAAAARLIAVSRTLASELVAALPEVGPKLVVVPNTVDLDAFRAAPLRERRRDELLYVGYRKASKGLETLFTAFARVRAARPTATLRLVGRSPDDEIEAGWRRSAQRLGIAEAIAFDGPADRAGVAEALARAAVFVHPSPRETFGVVAVEALAAGLPVVATDSGGVTEILGDHPDAFGAVVPPNDAPALAAAILETLAHLERFDPLTLRASVEGRFGRRAVAERLLALYDEVRAETPTRSADRGTRPAAPARQAKAATEPLRVLVAFDPDRARGVDALAPTLRERLVLVTSSGAGGPEAHRLAGSIESDLHGRVRATADAAVLGPRGSGTRRVLRALRHPFAVARRRGLLPGLERLVATRGTASVRAGVDLVRGLPRVRTTEVELVCLDGLDHLAAAAIIADGEAHLAPGGLRWLADQGLSERVAPR